MASPTSFADVVTTKGFGAGVSCTGFRKAWVVTLMFEIRLELLRVTIPFAHVSVVVLVKTFGTIDKDPRQTNAQCSHKKVRFRQTIQKKIIG